MPQPRRRKSRTGTWRWTGTTGRKRARSTGRSRPTPTPPKPSTSNVPRNGRAPTAVEEHVDFEALQQTWEAARSDLVTAWIGVRETQIVELAAAIERAGGDLAVLATVEATPTGDALVAAAMRRLARFGASTAAEEAKAQGVDLPEPDMEPVDADLAERADAVTTLLSRALSEVAGRRAVERTGSEALKPAEVASEVAEHLRGLSNAYLEEQLGGALTQGMNTGRRTAMGGAPHGTRYFGSALLDTNVCGPCREDDGHEFAGLLDAELTYPVGGNKDCRGGVRCRCTIVAQYPESAPSVE